jgi:hypothetical protein
LAGAPPTGLPWLGAAAQLTAWAQDCLPAVRGTLVQRAALVALLRAVKAGPGSAAEAIARL